jgi:hypothetical protein
VKAVFSLQGSQRTIFPLNKGLLKRMLEAKDLTPAQNRNVVVTVLGTQLCCRVGDLRRFQLCSTRTATPLAADSIEEALPFEFGTGSRIPSAGIAAESAEGVDWTIVYGVEDEKTDKEGWANLVDCLYESLQASSQMSSLPSTLCEQ